mmetsp:Transcript_1034/g.2162  ORF Transcript_1034/g.2162 Transcript_1034/m.2162 type:complete len:475 (-) Transcript_1034:174-1598(-)
MRGQHLVRDGNVSEARVVLNEAVEDSQKMQQKNQGVTTDEATSVREVELLDSVEIDTLAEETEGLCCFDRCLAVPWAPWWRGVSAVYPTLLEARSLLAYARSFPFKLWRPSSKPISALKKVQELLVEPFEGEEIQGDHQQEAERLWYGAYRLQLCAEAVTEEACRKLFVSTSKVKPRKNNLEAEQAAAELGLTPTAAVSEEEKEQLKKDGVAELSKATSYFCDALDGYAAAIGIIDKLKAGETPGEEGEKEENEETSPHVDDFCPPNLPPPMYENPSFESYVRCHTLLFDFKSGEGVSTDEAKDGFTYARRVIGAIMEKKGPCEDGFSLCRKLVREYIRHGMIEAASTLLQRLLIVEKESMSNLSSQYIQDISLQGTLIFTNGDSEQALKYYKRAITLLKESDYCSNQMPMPKKIFEELPMVAALRKRIEFVKDKLKEEGKVVDEVEQENSVVGREASNEKEGSGGEDENEGDE